MTVEVAETLPNQFVCFLDGDEHPWTGYVVVDSIINGKCTGGVRMMPTVSLLELKHMARAMTLKYGFLGIPRGGMKAGIKADPEGDPATKQAILAEFGRKLSPMVRRQILQLGMDMGVGPEDFDGLMRAAGLGEARSSDPVSHSRSGFFTSLTVFSGVKVATEAIGLDLGRCTAAIQGFGSVGSTLAQRLAGRGVKLIAVSTIKGAMHNADGFDIDDLLENARRHGSGMVEHLVGERIGMDELLELEVDVLSPCAGSWSVSLNNAHRIRAKVVCPGANCAVTPDAERILFDRGIVSVPHFAASCGGALGSTMEFLGCTEAQIESFVEREVERKQRNLVARARREGALPLDLAEEDALVKFGRMQRTQQANWRSRLMGIGMRAYKSGVLPAPVTRSLLPRYLGGRLWSDSTLTTGG